MTSRAWITEQRLTLEAEHLLLRAELRAALRIEAATDYPWHRTVPT